LRTKALAAPGAEDQIGLAPHDFTRIGNDAITRQRFLRQLGKDVVATGDAAIIGPNEQCADGVSEGFGSDAAGWQFSVATPVPAALTAPATPLVRISDVFQMPTQGRSIEFVQAIVPGPQPTPAEPLRWIFKTL